MGLPKHFQEIPSQIHVLKGGSRGGLLAYIYILEVQGRASRGLHFFPEPIMNLGTHREPWYQDLSTKILVPGSWYQDLVLGSWHHGLGTRILETRPLDFLEEVKAARSAALNSSINTLFEEAARTLASRTVLFAISTHLGSK